MSIAGLSIAWSRIYLGVHFPLDMVGAAAFAPASALLCLLGRTQVSSQAIEGA
jgi:undecaprenyl-diphosphatase